jgi:hypothetical protein
MLPREACLASHFLSVCQDLFKVFIVTTICLSLVTHYFLVQCGVFCFQLFVVDYVPAVNARRIFLQINPIIATNNLVVW